MKLVNQTKPINGGMWRNIFFNLSIFILIFGDLTGAQNQQKIETKTLVSDGQSHTLEISGQNMTMTQETLSDGTIVLRFTGKNIDVETSDDNTLTTKASSSSTNEVSSSSAEEASTLNCAKEEEKGEEEEDQNADESDDDSFRMPDESDDSMADRVFLWFQGLFWKASQHFGDVGREHRRMFFAFERD
ncbi:hypothetical protein niasHT_037453 [Heterodera trifolii]|uniref:Uncharacterized protein n=1 Tax=Heterodera trifolii TaxID=157864 RepID=A0ABD2IC26_9BILA